MHAAGKSKSDVKVVEDRPRGFLGRFVRTAMVVVIILYVATLLISRTDGFRYMVEERLKERTGAELNLGKVQMNMGMDLVLRDLAGPDLPERAVPGFQVERMTFRWSVPRFFQRGRVPLSRIVIEGADIRLVRNGEGRWQPAAFVEPVDVLSDWAGMVVPAPPRSPAEPRADDRSTDDALSEEIDVFRRETAYVIRETDIRWEEHDGTVLAALRNVRLDMTPLRVPPRDLQHVWLRVESGRTADGRTFRDLQVELAIHDQQATLLGRSVDWGSD